MTENCNWQEEFLGKAPTKQKDPKINKPSISEELQPKHNIWTSAFMEFLRNQKRLNSSKRFFPVSWSLPVQLFIAPCPISPCNLSAPACHPCYVSTSLFSKASQTLPAPARSNLSKTQALPDPAKSGFTMSAGSSSLCPPTCGLGPELD